MRDKELRLALICYGGISLAVYMHGVTKEVWRLAQASRAFHDDPERTDHPPGGYEALFAAIRAQCGMDLRVLPDIIAGASAGGINGVFLAQAISSGQSLEPLTTMWLDKADVEVLIAPEARPDSRWSKIWAEPIAWMATRNRPDLRGNPSDPVQQEIRSKLSAFVRSRWFEPPFGGAGFSSMLLDAFDAMAAEQPGARLLPPGQPLDLFVSVTDFRGHPVRLKLHSPLEARESEHRITLSFRNSGQKGDTLGHVAGLAFAARATASFPGAFPPFTVREIDGVLAARNARWDDRGAFLARSLSGHADPENAVLIDGSVLSNAPFEPAIAALRDRPARREVDRRFVYIDPKPGRRSVRLGAKSAEPHALPGFFGTILGAMSDIPREQPIRDSLEAIEGRSARIRRMQHVIESLRPGVEEAINRQFGLTFFLDKPTPQRLDNWRAKAQDAATREAGFAYAAYAHLKLSNIVEDLAHLAGRLDPQLKDEAYEDFRRQLWHEIRQRGIDQVWSPGRKGASTQTIAFFRAYDTGYRIRRLRFMLRSLAGLVDQGRVAEADVQGLRDQLFSLLAAYLDREGADFYLGISTIDAAAFLDAVSIRRNLSQLDAATDSDLAASFADCPKVERQTLLFAYLGFPFYDISTLPLLQGEGFDEFDPVKVDRISPEDAHAIRSGGVDATLKGVEFNSFGAFFSRVYRENDYLWGRLHGADRLFDIVCSAAPLPATGEDVQLKALKRALLEAILDEEEKRLGRIGPLIQQLRAEIAAGPLCA